jgi:aldose 1-epimerase
MNRTHWPVTSQQFKWLILLVAFTMTVSSLAAAASPRVDSQTFGTLPSGEAVSLFELENAVGTRVQVSSLGAALVSATVPDNRGRFDNVVLGYDSLDGYLKDQSFFGYTVGRFANRIAGGTFQIDGKSYTVDRNEGGNTLHGGRGGFHTKNWKGESAIADNVPSVTFTVESPDGDQGFPGKVTATVTYSLMPDNTLNIGFTAITDAPTVINMTNHAYFNLAGAGNGDILSHTLQLDADSYTATNDQLIPTGEIVPVKGTYLDFTTPLAIGARKSDWPAKLPGYDHNFVVRGRLGKIRRAALLIEPSTGRSLEVLTTSPGIQFYSGIHLSNVAGKDGKTYQQYGGLCLEAQNFPDAPNHPQFPSAVLRPGEEYKETIQYRFGVVK